MMTDQVYSLDCVEPWHNVTIDFLSTHDPHQVRQVWVCVWDCVRVLHVYLSAL